jgi:hypothetical protein
MGVPAGRPVAATSPAGKCLLRAPCAASPMHVQRLPSRRSDQGACTCSSRAVPCIRCAAGNVGNHIRPPPSPAGRRRLGPTQITPPAAPTADVAQPPAPTPESQQGFKLAGTQSGREQLTLLSLELHADSRGAKLPDPRCRRGRCLLLGTAYGMLLISKPNALLFVGAPSFNG